MIISPLTFNFFPIHHIHMLDKCFLESRMIGLGLSIKQPVYSWGSFRRLGNRIVYSRFLPPKIVKWNVHILGGTTREVALASIQYLLVFVLRRACLCRSDIANRFCTPLVLPPVLLLGEGDIFFELKNSTQKEKEKNLKLPLSTSSFPPSL